MGVFKKLKDVLFDVEEDDGLAEIDRESEEAKKEIIDKFKSNKTKALTAVGLAAVEVALDYMTNKYYRDIHLTGDLKRDVNYRVRTQDDAVDIGNSLNYAVAVHEGTGKMQKRPYLKDAVYENKDMWNQIFKEYLGNGI